MSEVTFYEQVTLTDQNTQRPVTWHVERALPAPKGRAGWTHLMAVRRPKGRRVYMLYVEMVGDVIVRHSLDNRPFI